MRHHVIRFCTLSASMHVNRRVVPINIVIMFSQLSSLRYAVAVYIPVEHREDGRPISAVVTPKSRNRTLMGSSLLPLVCSHT